MSEIDKLVNQAYPDELRRVSPIAVNEEAVLARTLDKLGLEGSEPAKNQTKKKKGRYVGRHEAQREIHLVEVPQEPAPKHRWIGWIGWAAAACLLITCAVRFGPFLLSNILVDPHSAAGQAALGGYVGGMEDRTEGGAAGAEETETEFAKSAGAETAKARAPACDRVLEEIVSSLDQVKAVGQAYEGRISILRISKIDENDTFTVAVHFPNMDQLTVAQFLITIQGVDAYGQELNVLELKRENVDGFAYLTYHLVQHNCGGTALDQGTMRIFYSPSVNAYDTNAYTDPDLDPDLMVAYRIFLGSKVSSVSWRLSEQEMEELGITPGSSGSNAAIYPNGADNMPDDYDE